MCFRMFTLSRAHKPCSTQVVLPHLVPHSIPVSPRAQALSGVATLNNLSSLKAQGPTTLSKYLLRVSSVVFTLSWIA